MRTAFLLLAAAGICFGGLMSHGQEARKAPEKKERPDPKTVKALMGQKLDHNQKLLAALVSNHLDEAAKQAEDLVKVRKDVAWMILKTKEYELWSDEFNRSAEKVIKAAKEKNADAAKLGYLELTLTCFHCHTYVRDMGGIGTATDEK